MEAGNAKKIHVIGATGHIGSYLCPFLVKEGFGVTGYHRGEQSPYPVHADGFASVGLKRMERKSAVDAALSDGADVICDLIPYTMEDAEYICERILADKRKDEIQLISVGSIWIYGIQKGRVDETSPRLAEDDYGKNKAMIERYLLEQSVENGLNVTIIHPGHICGRGWIPVGPTGNRDLRVFEAVKAGEEIILPEDGGATLQHVHSLDIAGIIRCVIGNEKARGESFNIACKKPISLKEYAEGLYDYFGKKPKIGYVSYEEFLKGLSPEEAAVSAEHIDRSPNVSMEKAERILGFENSYTEMETILDSLHGLII